LQLLGIEPVWFGDHDNPLLRLGVLGAKLAAFRPHFVQSANFFTNLYVGLGSRVCRALGIGTLRSDLTYEMEQNGGWARWLLRLPPVLLANSFAARRNAEALGVPPDRIAVLPNVIDLADFDARRAATDTRAGGESIAAVVGTLFPVKRFDRFLTALARARRLAPGLKGMIIGDGPERAALEQKAQALGLLPDAVRFMGHRRDVTALLGGADMLVISSDHEGFPNVVLEGMAASLPVVTTPAGDAGVVVEHGRSGYVVPFDDGEAMAVRMAHLARFPQLCRQLGTAARQRVERHYSFATLTDRLLDVYRGFARGQARQDLLRRLP